MLIKLLDKKVRNMGEHTKTTTEYQMGHYYIKFTDYADVIDVKSTFAGKLDGPSFLYFYSDGAILLDFERMLIQGIKPEEVDDFIENIKEAKTVALYIQKNINNLIKGDIKEDVVL